MYWVYGPDQKEITVIGLEPHPEDAKMVRMIVSLYRNLDKRN